MKQTEQEAAAPCPKTDVFNSCLRLRHGPRPICVPVPTTCTNAPNARVCIRIATFLGSLGVSEVNLAG